MRSVGLSYALVFPAKLKTVHNQRSHFFDTLEAARDWLDHYYLDSCGHTQRHSPPTKPRHLPRRRPRGEPMGTHIRGASTAQQALESQRGALCSATALRDPDPPLSASGSSWGSVSDYNTNVSMALFLGVTPQTVNDLLG
ncbi:hypothetical protein NDU88_001447 [Pleurodeles waltl]|uniref:Uncharacterized protein n=1 Tax=Pleurodeles waltl TaxID=8319 RepID=A0AAV7UVD4_PLEWA|nr:hypothetical protein NDU88_001447 [Pleurodeles waltl]